MIETEKVLEKIAGRLHRRDILVGDRLYLSRYYLVGGMSSRLADLWPEDDRPPANHDNDWTCYLHCFHQPDPDRDLHNHPWRATSTILWGGYEEVQIALTELDPDGVRVTPRSQELHHIRRPGDEYELFPDTYHSITRLMTPRVWTLFAHGPKERSWGFLIDGRHVPHREYGR